MMPQVGTSASPVLQRLVRVILHAAHRIAAHPLRRRIALNACCGRAKINGPLRCMVRHRQGEMQRRSRRRPSEGAFRALPDRES